MARLERGPRRWGALGAGILGAILIASGLPVPIAGGLATAAAPNAPTSGPANPIAAAFGVLPFASPRSAPATASVAFQESGLPTGTNYTVTFGNESRTAAAPAPATFAGFPPGAYPFDVAPVAGYVANLSTGTIFLGGLASVVAIQFVAAPAGTFPVVIQETGLPPGHSWTASIDRRSTTSNQSEVLFALPNGTYPLATSTVGDYLPWPGPNATVVVAGAGTGATASFVFAYPATVSPQGLSAGTRWTLSISQTEGSGAGPPWLWTGSTTAPELVVDLENGTYSFAISAARFAPVRGALAVAGAPVHLAPPMAPYTYPVSFVERGLPAGTNWTVAVNGTRFSSTSSTIVIPLPNGTYTFAISPSPAGYAPTPGAGSIRVAGNGSFVAVAFGAGPGLFGWPGIDGDLVVGGLLVALAALGIAISFFVRARRQVRREEERDPPARVGDSR